MIFSKRYLLPFRTIIPNNVKQQLNSETLSHKLKEYWCLLRREMYLFVSGQKRLERRAIPLGAKKILWLAPSIRNIGDAIMGFSGRTLFIGEYQVDILLDAKVKSLFNNDDIFKHVYTSAEEITGSYDLIILDSVKSISLKTKKRYFSRIPYCHFRGHFDGIEFNWTLFSYHRINALLNYPYQQSALDAIAKPHLVSQKSKSLPYFDLAIAVGGEDIQRRTYNQWGKVVQVLLQVVPSLKIVLLGNQNGSAVATELADSFSANITNFVAKSTLTEAVQLIDNSRFFLGCDGGLMHIAVASDKPGVALFGHFEPQYRLPLNIKISALFDDDSVNLIEPQQIVDCLIAQFAPVNLQSNGGVNG